MPSMNCPHCGVPFRVPPQARKSAPCPACRKDVDVSEVAIPDAILLDRPRKKRRPGRRRWRERQDPLDGLWRALRVLVGLGLVGGGLVFFLLGGLLTIHFFSGGGGDAVSKGAAAGVVVGPAMCYWGYKAFKGEWD